MSKTKKTTAPDPIVVLEEWRDNWSPLRLAYHGTTRRIRLEFGDDTGWHDYAIARDSDTMSFTMPVFK